MTDYWLQSALTNDVLVAELLLRVKHSSDSISDLDSLRAPPPTATTTSITTILPPRWGHRRYRSKSTASTTAGGKEHRGSPTTHLSWSGGSISDGFDESSRPSDLLSGGRSVKVNEGPSTSSYNKFEKRKNGLNENWWLLDARKHSENVITNSKKVATELRSKSNNDRKSLLRMKGKQSIKPVVDDDDDDFVSPPERHIKHKPNAKSVSGPSQQTFVPYTNKKLKARVGIINLKNSVTGLSKQQINAIKSMGFRPFLSLDIDTIPTRFAQWLVSNYDCDRNKLNAGHHNIQVTSQTVKDVLGIPLGRLPVNEKNKPRMGSLDTLRLWKSQYPGKSRITVKDVIEQMKKSEEGARGLDEYSPSRIEIDPIDPAVQDGDEEPSASSFDRPHPCDLVYPIGSYIQRVIDETYTPLTMTGVSAYTHSIPPTESVKQQLSTSNLQTNQPITEVEEAAVNLNDVIPQIPFLQLENIEKVNTKTLPEEKTPALEIRFQYKKRPREKNLSEDLRSPYVERSVVFGSKLTKEERIISQYCLDPRKDP
ncbi:hypothetical protein E3N88_24721 [Mikania micrantha]|uniref:Uncharacterized protein n=1 Tax=Mikania micrantha TaxID=192012 RepID=A0A5N6N3Z8_9ASTR|nr:hypothetical protein E3N88_24721 [Mikania micrantha]